ncbi:MAG: MFS transporter [Caldilineaceae bacterium]|nr:MFS transporter [Caldilineaceae bacterium]
MFILKSIRQFFQPTTTIPLALRRVFFHLYWDIAWFGILSGSTLSFLSIYATRLGADAFQIGLLSAGPAVVGLLFTLPAGRWLQGRPVGGAVFWSAVLARFGYLLMAVLPLLLPASLQIGALVLLVLVMTIPNSVLSIGFNALYASAVAPEWRGHVAGIRNAMLALVFVITSLLCGWLLNRLPFTMGYFVIFTLGFIGAAMSTVHLWFLRHITGETEPGPPQIRGVIGDLARPGDIRILGITLRTSIAPRAFARGANLLRLEVLRGAYGQIVAALLLFHIALYIPIPLMPLYWVDHLHFSDGDISLGTAIFHCAVLLGSLRVGRLAERFGNHRITVVGGVLLSLYPLLTAVMTNLGVYLIVSVIGGAAWSLVGGAIGNYLLENVPKTDRPAYLAWYNLALNLAVLLGSLIGPLLADSFGLIEALFLSFVARLLGVLAIWLVRQPTPQPSTVVE